MEKSIVVALVLFFSTAVHSAITDEEACDKGQSSYQKQGMTKDDCLCMLGEAEKHLQPNVKQAYIESLLAEEKNPMQRLMDLGIPLEDLMRSMSAYGISLEKNCGL